MKLKVKLKVYAIRNKKGATDYAVATADSEPIVVGLHDDAGVYWQMESEAYHLSDFALQHGFEYAETEVEQEVSVQWQKIFSI